MPLHAVRPLPSGHRAARRRPVRAALTVLAVALSTTAIVLCLLASGRPGSASASDSEIVRALPAPAPSAWPAAGQAAIAGAGGGEYASPAQKPVPTASTAKLMTAYVFLSRFPLRPGQPGPTFTVSADEAARYTARAATESVVPLRPNQRMTERAALQALLAPSANNVADELARWYGSGPTAFLAEMNRTARQLGMNETHYTDVTGLRASTVSTAADQVRLLRAALRLPDFAALASSSYTDILGRHHANTNPMLGRDGVFAGKTGTTTAAGSNLVFATRRATTDGSRVIVGAVLHQPNASVRDKAVRQLIAHSLVTAPVVRQGETLAWADDGWGRSVALRADHDLKVTGPPGCPVTVTVKPGTALAPGDREGTTAARAVVTGLRPDDAGSPDGTSGGPAPGAVDTAATRAGVTLRTGAPLPRTPPLAWLPMRPLAWLADAAGL